MANYVFNIAKGKIAGYVDRVDSGLVAAAQIVLIPLSASGSEAQGQDFDDVAAVLADAAFTEQTGSTWARKDLDDADVSEVVDDTNNRMDCQIDTAQTWSAVLTGNDTTGMLIAYDPTGAGADNTLIPLAHCDFAVTTDGSDVQLNTGDFCRSS